MGKTQTPRQRLTRQVKDKVPERLILQAQKPVLQKPDVMDEKAEEFQLLLDDLIDLHIYMDLLSFERVSLQKEYSGLDYDKRTINDSNKTCDSKTCDSKTYDKLCISDENKMCDKEKVRAELFSFRFVPFKQKWCRGREGIQQVISRIWRNKHLTGHRKKQFIMDVQKTIPIDIQTMIDL